MVFLFVVQYCIANVHGPGYNYSFRGPQYLPPQGRVASVNSSSAIREVMVDHVILNLASAKPL